MRIVIAVFLVLLCSCQEPEKPKETNSSETAIFELQSVDAAFSEKSKKEGFRKAYLEFIDDDGMLMRDNSLPFKGAKAIETISSWNDSSVVLSWEPLGADVAASGELGYTYGTYEMRDHADQVEKGTYVTVWKKNKNGVWKFVLDSNNQGIGE